MPEPTTTACAYGPCDCRVAPHDLVARDGKQFCSVRCADGRGCDHHGCNCGDFMTEEPDPAQV